MGVTGKCGSVSCLRLRVGFAQACLTSSGRGDHQANDKAIKAKSLCENQNQDHADEQSRLLGVCSDACIVGTRIHNQKNPNKYNKASTISTHVAVQPLTAQLTVSHPSVQLA